ncbi:hypothetical protein M5K25_003979 [Dendrobium thyrsiflorum]|uniref:DUF1421 domain-containing protein n=1 Tax=Dendrobium thyrsiflorum TaxID=117978 RepID=A0ABD0VSD9_DENTH
MNSSPFMDKQIMGLSGSPAGIGGIGVGGGGEFFDLMNPQEERRDNGGVLKREEILPSYDFQPIRPVSSPPTSSGDDASRHSRFPSGPLFRETMLGPDIKLANDHGASVEDVENTVKKYVDIILHALEGMSSRLSQLESRTCILENSVDDLKVSIGNNYGSTDGKLRQMENILREVQTGVQVLRDKQEITEAHLELAKLQLSTKADHLQSESALAPSELQQKQHYQHQQAHPPQPQQPIQQAPQLSAITPSQPPPPPPPLPAPNAPPPPPPPLPQQSQLPVPYAAQLPLQHQMTSMPSLPEQQYSKPSHQLTQYTPTGQPNEPIHQQQQYQMPPSHPQPQSGLPQSQLYQSSPQVPQYSQPIQPEEPNTYMPPSQSYLPNIRQPSPQSPTGPPLHQYYGTNPPLYELPPANRPSSGNIPISSSYGGPGLSEPYIYGNSPSHYNSKPSPFSSAPPTSGGSGSYQRLPTAKLLPQAASVGSNAGGGGPTGNRVAVDDVVDKVSTMGFSREQVRATVRKLTENGQSVDLNVVLDKLMNDGEVHQPAKGWFGR